MCSSGVALTKECLRADRSAVFWRGLMGRGLGAGWTIVVVACAMVGAFVLWRLDQIGWPPVAGLTFVLLCLIVAAFLERRRA